MEDAVLVQQAQAGNQPAYEELIRRYARLVWACIYGIIQDPAWTEDLVQDTFFKGWQSLNDLREPGAFRGWLVMIARRNALMHNERHAHRASLWAGRQEQALEQIASRAATAAPTVNETDDLRSQLHTALSQLPERYRLPITLRHLEGFDYNKIAELLDLTDGSLRGLLNRGMKMLKERVKLTAETQGAQS